MASTEPDAREIVVGPLSELHAGVHGALLEDPPPGVRYTMVPHERCFQFQRGSVTDFDPFEQFSLSETVAYRLPRFSRHIVHSIQFPVANAVSWIAQVDSLLSVLRYGHFFATASATSIRRGELSPRLVRRRERRMLRHYLSPRCTALLFHTRHERRRVFKELASGGLLAGAELARLARKSVVVYPTIRPRTRRRDRGERLSILYAGRSRDKGGEIAAEVFARLARERTDVRLVYVGEPPANASLDPQVVTFPLLPRPLYMALLGTCDVFFAPTHFESYGMALVEAASRGLAVVTTCGSGMEHVTELFEPNRHALYVPNALPGRDKVEHATTLLTMLIERPSERERIRTESALLFADGPLSMRERDRRLLGVYSKCALARRRSGNNKSSDASGLSSARIDETRCLDELRRRTGGRWIRTDLTA